MCENVGGGGAEPCNLLASAAVLVGCLLTVARKTTLPSRTPPVHPCQSLLGCGTRSASSTFKPWSKPGSTRRQLPCAHGCSRCALLLLPCCMGRTGQLPSCAASHCCPCQPPHHLACWRTPTSPGRPQLVCALAGRLQGNALAWERWAFTFAQLRALPALAPHLPTQEPQLKASTYDLVLSSALLHPAGEHRPPLPARRCLGFWLQVPQRCPPLLGLCLVD